jgi:hypothetical protein
MARTQAELLAWSVRVRDEAVAIRQQARATRASAQAIREQRSAVPAAPYGRPAPPCRSLAMIVDENVSIEDAAERALLLDLTAREIADHLGVPFDYVVQAARERAAYLDGAVEDTLRSWFRALLAPRSGTTG